HRGRRGTPAVTRRLDRQRRQVAGDAGKQCYLGFGDGAAARRPLAAEGKVVERKRLQIGPSIAREAGSLSFSLRGLATQLQVRGVNLWPLSIRTRRSLGGARRRSPRHFGSPCHYFSPPH